MLAATVDELLMFQDRYTRELIGLGYQDAMKRSDDLLSFPADSRWTGPARRRSCALHLRQRTSAPRPSSEAKPTVCGNRRQHHAPASAGSIPSPAQKQGTLTPASAAASRLIISAAKMIARSSTCGPMRQRCDYSPRPHHEQSDQDARRVNSQRAFDVSTCRAPGRG